MGLGPCASTPTPSSPSSPTTAAPQVWKWGSGRRLFHVATARCLGLNVVTKAPGLFPCNSTGVQGVLQWRCLEGALLTAYEMGLAVSGSTVVAKHDASDAWTADEGPEKVCQRAYRGEYGSVTGVAGTQPEGRGPIGVTQLPVGGR